ncbi:MAG: flippase [Azonexus sp.]|nr:flippase [Azonexus sp.]
MSLRRNTIWNMVGTGLPLLAGVAFIPFILKQLGGEAFGVVALIWALIGYFGLFDMGVGRALTFEISKLLADGQDAKVSGALKAGLLVTIVTGVVGAIVMLLIAPLLAHSWLKISPEWQSDTQLAFQIAALGVLPTTVTSGLRGALEGFGRFAESNVIRLFFGLSMFALPALSVSLHGNTLWCIALYLVGARLIVVMLSLIQLRYHLFNSTGSLAIKSQIGALFSYGFWVTVSGVIGPLMIYGDRFFVAGVVGAEQLQYYAIPQEGLQRLLIIPVALCGALLPILTPLRGGALVDIYKINQRRIAFTMLAACMIAAALAYPVLSLWLTPDFAQKALPVVLILAVGIWLNSIAQLPYTVLHALGKPRLTAMFHLVELAFYFVVLYWLATVFGLLGAATAWLLRVLLDLMLLHFAVNRYFKKEQNLV